MMRRALAWWALALAMGLASPSTGLGQPPRTRLPVTYISPSPATAPLWVAQDAGLLAKHGLDVSLIFVDGSVKSIQMLLAGDVPVAGSVGTANVNARLAGADVVMFAATMDFLPYFLIGSPEIRGPAELRGKIGANHNPGTSADFAIRVGLARLGLHPDRDVTLRNIGGTNLRLAALQRGLVHFLVVTQGERVAAERMGFRLISDLAALKIPFPMTGYTATERYIRSRPEVIRGFTRAITEAIHYFKQHRETSIAILARRSHLKDRAALEETYRWYQQHLPEAPYPPVEGFRVILQELARTRPELAGVDPQRFADTSFVKGLEDSGFIRALSWRP